MRLKSTLLALISLTAFVAGEPALARQKSIQAISLEQSDAFSYHRSACCQSDNGDYSAALSYINQAIKCAPNESMYYRTRAHIKSKLGNLAGAIKDCSKAIMINPRDANAFDQRGYLRSNLNDSHGALEDFEAGLKIEPNNAGCNLDLGLELLLLKNYNEATKKLDLAVKNCPDKGTYGLRGCAKMGLRCWTGARSDFDTAIALDSNIALFYFYRMKCKAELGDIPGAVADYLVGTSKDPSLGAMHISSGLRGIWSRLAPSVHNFH